MKPNDRLRSALATATVLLSCAGGDRRAPPSPSSNGDAGAGASAGRSSVGAAGQDETSAGAAGQGGLDTGAGSPGHGTAGSDSGESGSSGAPEASAGRTSASEGGSAGDDGALEPAPDPLCERGLRWRTGTLLPVSAAGDDLIQALTPDGLTLVWQNGERFFVAARATAAEDFGPPLEVAEGLGFGSVTVSPDGLRLIGARDTGFFELTRPTRTEPFSTTPSEDNFLPFNQAANGIPTDESALEPLLAADDSYLVYSLVSPSNAGIRPTIYATEWLGQWSFGSAIMGQKLLWSDAQKRRIPTGLSSDRLTLFYWDEVEGELRAAWRTRPDEPFDHYESLGGWRRAAPNGACDELYYSSDGEADLDLFAATAE